MNTWNKFLRASVSLLTMAVIAALCAPSASAQVTTIMSTQTFSSSTFPPSGWSNGGGFYYTTYGDGGAGAAYCDVWDYGVGPLGTPSVNVSAYAFKTDSVWVDYDFFWEYNAYITYGADKFELEANSDVLVSGTQATLYTYYNTSDDTYTPDETSSSDWVHYHVLIPVSDRTSSMVINFTESPDWGCSDFAIDNVTITGKLVVPSELSLEPHSYNFGTATPNSPDTLYATVKSVGSATLHFLANGGITGTNASAFSIVSGPKLGDSMQVGTTRQYAIKFQPFTSGSLSATFTAYTDGGDSGTQSIALNGVGSVPNVAYGVNNLYHQVFTELGDTAAGVQSVRVSSTGVGPLTFNSISFVGLNANNYFITHTPQNPLPSGSTDSISISFAPTIEGRPDATLIISTNATNIPLDTVLLYGDGILPHLAITLPSPSSGKTLNFDSVALGDSVCQTMTLTNPGSDTLLLLRQLLTSGDPDFTFYPLTGTDTIILPGASKLVNVCFKPLDHGTREASLRFFTNIPLTFTTPRKDTSQFPINVTGVGVPYGQLVLKGQMIDSAAVGKTNCIIDTFENAGLASLTVNTSAITGPNSSWFTINSGAPFTLAPGQSMPVTICFDAASAGPQVDTIWASGVTSEQNFKDAFSITGYGAHICASAAPMALTFGGMTLATKTAMDTVTVTNCGDYPSTYTGRITAGATAYSLPAASSIGPIMPGASGQFIVEFSPTAIGAVNDTLEISGTEGPVANIAVALNGVGAGVIASATGAPASAVSLNSCDTFSVTVSNTGNFPWTPGMGTISGTNASDFSIVSGPTPAAIPANGTATVMVSFCPSMLGTESMTLTFPNGTPTPIPPLSYNVNGIGASSGVAMKAEQDGFVLGQSYPNPASGLAEVSFTLPNDASISIVLMDLTGQTVQSVFTGNLSAGAHTLPMNVNSLSSGTYFYTLTSGDVQLTRQMTIVR